MIKYYKKFTHTIGEIGGQPTLMVYSLGGCNFNCYGCFNKKEVVENKGEEYFTIDDIVKHIRLNPMYKFLVFSGGEFLINSLSDISQDLKAIRKNTLIKIIIYTNGSYPEKLEHLLSNNLIDGIHMDVKLPYHYADPNLDILWQRILGLNKYSFKTARSLLHSIDLVILNNKGWNQFRTVRYPFFKEEEIFQDIEQYLSARAEKLGCKKVEYVINDFLNIGE